MAKIKCKVILSVEDSPRGNYQKMLVIRTPQNYLTTTAFIRQHGIDGLVMHYQSSGIKPRLEPQSGKKRFELDEGLVFFPLTHNVKPIQVDAEIAGAQLVIAHLPPEIFRPIPYTETPAPAKIPASGPPVRIMRDVKIKVSQIKGQSKGDVSIAFAMDEELGKLLERVSVRAYGVDGLQLVTTPTGTRFQRIKPPRLGW